MTNVGTEDKAMNSDRMIELASNEVAHVSGGIVPLVPIAIAFGKGFIGGVGAAAAAHVAIEAYELLTS